MDRGVRTVLVVLVDLLVLKTLLGQAGQGGLRLQGNHLDLVDLVGLVGQGILVALEGLDPVALLALIDDWRKSWSWTRKSGGSAELAGWLLSFLGALQLNCAGLLAVADWGLDCSLCCWGRIA